MGFVIFLPVFFLVIGSSTISANGGLDCPHGFVQSGWNCYYFSKQSGGTGTWDQAKRHCESMSAGTNYVGLAELGDPSNAGSDNWLMETITSDKNQVWLGASDPCHNGVFKWNSGRPLSNHFPLWGPSEPNNHKMNENCVQSYPFTIEYGSKRQYLADGNCEQDLHYVCQLFTSTFRELQAICPDSAPVSAAAFVGNTPFSAAAFDANSPFNAPTFDANSPFSAAYNARTFADARILGRAPASVAKRLPGRARARAPARQWGK